MPALPTEPEVKQTRHHTIERLRRDPRNAVVLDLLDPVSGLGSALSAPFPEWMDRAPCASLANAAGAPEKVSTHQREVTEDQSSTADPALGVFFPEGRGRGGRTNRANQQALAMCQSCPVIARCLRYALEYDIKDGIWGGTTGPERKVLRAQIKERQASLRRPGSAAHSGGRHQPSGSAR